MLNTAANLTNMELVQAWTELELHEERRGSGESGMVPYSQTFLGQMHLKIDWLFAICISTF